MSVSWKSSHDCFWSWMSRPSYISRCTAKALNESYHAGSRQGSTGQARALNQIGLNGSRDHREATAERIGTAGEEQAQGPGKAQNPLAYRNVRNDVID